jgi:hypothetical protein
MRLIKALFGGITRVGKTVIWKRKLLTGSRLQRI